MPIENGDFTSQEAEWCLIGNIRQQQIWGDGVGGTVAREGTKHFVGGTKVYCLRPYWTSDRITVIGRRRGSRKLVTLIMDSQLIENWRAKLIHHPEVIRRLRDAIRQWESEQQILDFIKQRLNGPA